MIKNIIIKDLYKIGIKHLLPSFVFFSGSILCFTMGVSIAYEKFRIFEIQNILEGVLGLVFTILFGIIFFAFAIEEIFEKLKEQGIKALSSSENNLLTKISDSDLMGLMEGNKRETYQAFLKSNDKVIGIKNNLLTIFDENSDEIIYTEHLRYTFAVQIFEIIKNKNNSIYLEQKQKENKTKLKYQRLLELKDLLKDEDLNIEEMKEQISSLQKEMNNKS